MERVVYMLEANNGYAWRFLVCDLIIRTISTFALLT